MASCAMCGDARYQILALTPDVSVCVCEACKPELLALMIEPVQLPGRNSPCPECLENGVNVKMKKCRLHNDTGQGDSNVTIPQCVERVRSELTCSDERHSEKEEGSYNGSADGEGAAQNETKVV
jgi:hypothetical protein